MTPEESKLAELLARVAYLEKQDKAFTEWQQTITRANNLHIRLDNTISVVMDNHHKHLQLLENENRFLKEQLSDALKLQSDIIECLNNIQEGLREIGLKTTFDIPKMSVIK